MTDFLECLHLGRDCVGNIVNSMLTFVVDPERLIDLEWMQHEIDALVTYVKASPPRDPENSVMVAGDPERKSMAIRQIKGIPIAPGAWGRILKAGETVGAERAILESYIS